MENCEYTYKTQDFNKSRNYILDVMREGRKINTIYANIEIDITNPLKRIKDYKMLGKGSISLTAFLARCLSIAVDHDKKMHALRKKKKLMIFEEVDIAYQIEREVEGQLQPVNFISRGTNKKGLIQIQNELRKAATSPLGGDLAMNKIETFFWKWPTFLRKIFWYFSRKSPKLRKTFLGTVGLTSMGMFGTGNVNVFPITPMTLTLAVGTMEKKLRKIKCTSGKNEKIEERDILHAVLCVNHDIIDGGPLMRFTESFKKIVEEGKELPKIDPKMSSIKFQKNETTYVSSSLN